MARGRESFLGDVCIGGASGKPPSMTDMEREDKDFTEEAADATEEARRRAGEEGRTIEDQPESGRIADDDGDDDRETAF